ncbi:hypothetical protein RB595_001831 [Gaeumannomyces hyphopodioides]
MPRSRSTSSPSGAQRLPVNPRRHKVSPDKRKRVATACNLKRVKCSGEQPCRQCETASRDCVYPVAIDKVSIPKSQLEKLQSKCATLERCLQVLDPDNTRRGQFDFNTSPRRSLSISYDNSASAGDLGTSSPTTSSTVGEGEESQSPPEDGRLLHDTDGTARYLGETSGATFLDNLKQFMSTIFPLAFNGGSIPEYGAGNTFLASVGRYQTSDSRPLPAPNVNPLWLPSRKKVLEKLGQVRAFIQDDGMSGGIYFWGDLSTFHDGSSYGAAPRLPSTAEDLVAHRGLAFYHAALAYASLFDPATTNSKQEGELSFACARILLGNPLEVSTYSSPDIATMALMGMYMVEMNRRDAAYMYITTAMHISIMQGIHRGCGTDELGKRIFWTVYILDRWISCLMGRPPTIMDDAIRLDGPHDVPGMPSPVGLGAHIALMRISGHIVCNTYRVARNTWADASPATAGVSHVDKTLQLLANWLRDLPKELCMSYETPPQDRPLCTLHMSHNQLLILTIRPVFLIAVKKAVADRFLPQPWQQQSGQAGAGPQHQDHSDGSSPPLNHRLARPPFRTRSAGIEGHHPQIGLFRKCSEAARCNLRLGRWLAEISPASKLLLPDLHCVFNAAIMLLLHQIAFVDLQPADTPDIEFAFKAFSSEAALGDTYATDCLRVMQDLASLVHKLRTLMFTGVPHTPSPQFGPNAAVPGAASGVATSTGASATPSPLLITMPPTSLSRGAAGGGALGQQQQPLSGSGMEGSQSASIPTYLDAHGIVYPGLPNIPGSAAIIGDPTPSIVFDPMATPTSTGLMDSGGALYTQLLAWWQTDSMNEMYAQRYM